MKINYILFMLLAFNVNFIFGSHDCEITLKKQKALEILRRYFSNGGMLSIIFKADNKELINAINILLIEDIIKNMREKTGMDLRANISNNDLNIKITMFFVLSNIIIGVGCLGYIIYEIFKNNKKIKKHILSWFKNDKIINIGPEIYSFILKKNNKKNNIN